MYNRVRTLTYCTYIPSRSLLFGTFASVRISQHIYTTSFNDMLQYTHAEAVASGGTVNLAASSSKSASLCR